MASSRRGSANSVQEARRASRFVSSTRSRRRGGIAFALAFGAIVLLAIGIWVVEGALYPHTASGTHMPSQNLRLLDRIPLRSSSWEKGAHDSYFAVLSTASSVLKRLWNKYDTMLESAPLLTNSLSTCLISVVGDLLAQFFETRKSRNIFHSVSVMRMLAVGLDGLVVSGPVTVLGHQLLEWLAPSHSSWLAAWFHMVVDETVLDAISLASFFVVTGLLEGRTLIKVLQQFREEFFCAFYGAKLSSLVLLPFTMFQFFGVSHKYRILAISLGDILWIASTSFHCHRNHIEAVTCQSSDDATVGGWCGDANNENLRSRHRRGHVMWSRNVNGRLIKRCYEVNASGHVIRVD